MLHYVKTKLRLRLGLLVSISAVLLLCSQTSGATAGWSHKAVAGNIAYFVFDAPARIERYNLAIGQWQPSIPLSSAPTAFAVDTSEMVIAYGRTIVSRAPDGTGEVDLLNTADEVKGLLLTPQFIFAFNPTYSRPTITSIRRSDRQVVDTWSGVYAFGSGFAVAPATRRLYGLDTMTSGGELQELDFNADGTFPASYPGYRSAGANYYSSALYPRTYISGDERTLILGAGYVFDAESLIYRASLAGSFDDLAFYGDDIPIVLRKNLILAYTSAYLEAGRYELPNAAQAVAVRAGEVYAFSAAAAETSGVAVTKVAIASFSVVQPGIPVDPAGVAFVPDDVVAADDGTFFLLSKAYQSIFRWSAETRSYVATYSLLGSPSFIAYSSVLDRLYTAYGSGSINQIKLDAGSVAEEPFANLPGPAQGLQTAGDLVFAVDPSGAWNTYYVFDRAGSLKSSKQWGYRSREYIWNASLRRMYFFRDDTSPNDIHYQSIDASGQMGSAGESPYHGSYSFLHPIRVSADGASVLIGSGIVFDTSTLSYLGAIPSGIVDGVSHDNRWVTIRSAGADTQLQAWTQNLLLNQTLTIPGYAFRIFNLPDSRLLVFTTSDGAVVSGPFGTLPNSGSLVMSVVSLDGEGSVQSSPLIVASPRTRPDIAGAP